MFDSLTGRVRAATFPQEQFEKFAQEQIGPHTQAAGFPGPPQLTFHPIHSHMTKG